MDNQNNTPPFHQTVARIEDRAALVGELEHARRHALKSGKNATEREDKIFYYAKAGEAEGLRRRLEHRLGEIATSDWCLVKSGASIKQLNEETFEGDMQLFEDIEIFADSLISHGVGTDISGCAACAEDMGVLN